MALTNKEVFELISAAAIGLVIISMLIRWFLHRHHQAGPYTVPQEELIFSSTGNGRAVWEHANDAFYAYLLKELQTALKREGYCLTRKVSERTMMPEHVRRRISETMVRMRGHYLAPKQDEKALQNCVEISLTDGYADTLLEWLFKGCEAQGWHIALCADASGAGEYIPSQTTWSAHAYPLQQVIIQVTASNRAITSDLTRCLETIAGTLRETPFPASGDSMKLAGNYGYTGSTNPYLPVNYELLCQHCAISPGFFVDDYGSVLPHYFEEERERLKSLPGLHITVVVQGTRHTFTETLAQFVEQAAKRLRLGEHEGAEYDDDAGYAFIKERIAVPEVEST